MKNSKSIWNTTMNNRTEKETTALPGFRLERFEVLNWGTFDQKIWTLKTDSHNSLLTGDIGSGKSTLIDAITTLLVPSGKITYNKAAGAEGKERSLSDYILGHYKKEKDSDALQAKAISLRNKESAFTVLLGCFYDSNFNETVTLVQVMWLRENKSQPERFFLISSAPLTIEKDIYQPGTDVLTLKKKLKADPLNRVYEAYSHYSAEFRRRMAIQSHQAIELLYQTVSMKSIGNLTDFVRNHMLETTDAEEDIKALCQNFDNLNQAHEAVIKAREQIAALTPLIEECDMYDATELETEELSLARDSIYSYMAKIKTGLLSSKIERLEHEKNRTEKNIEKNTKDTESLESAREKIRRDIEDNGGRRHAELEREINELNEEKTRRKDRCDFYSSLADKISLTLPNNEDDFYKNISPIKEKISSYEEQQKNKRAEETDARIEMKRLDNEYQTIEVELESLKNRPSNIPSHNLTIRKKLCDSLGIKEEEIPFAGELIEVRENESQWEGAIERLIHNFGLSLLVNDEFYEEVSDYVDRTNLRGRIVYYRIKDSKDRKTVQSEPGMVISKINIKSGSSFYPWLNSEISSRFDYVCCEDIEEFRLQPRALTMAGQIKSGPIRHEKDDRNKIDDKSRYILGWKNEEKIKILKEQLYVIQKSRQGYIQKIQEVEHELINLSKKRDAARDISSIHDYKEIDWKSIVKKIDNCVQELKALEESADILHTLKEQLDILEKDLREKRSKNNDLLSKKGELNSQLNDSIEALKQADETFNSLTPELRDRTFPILDKVKEESFSEKNITLTNIEDNQKKIRESVQKLIDNLTSQNRRRNEKISSQMQSYKIKYPMETSEIDARIEAANEYRKILNDLVEQDLPRHEERFKRLLREGTIQDIALFQNKLEKERIEITGKIETINESLREIEYNRGSYITLIPDRAMDSEILKFQEDLRLCMGGTLNEDGDVYTEAKFHQVKNLIDRFEGRQGLTDLDRKWTAKVTDVRNWFVFSASERWKEDDSEREFYSDSSGKSGGQKEKLAYTILAAALAYQFSLVKDGLFNRSFRFVMIDEAFGRGSDESARYGLELFKKLELQLLIVTPLQKIHIIEDYVKSVHFVYQEDNRSLVGHMTIDKYKTKKKEWEIPIQ